METPLMETPFFDVSNFDGQISIFIGINMSNLSTLNWGKLACAVVLNQDKTSNVHPFSGFMMENI